LSNRTNDEQARETGLWCGVLLAPQALASAYSPDARPINLDFIGTYIVSKKRKCRNFRFFNSLHSIDNFEIREVFG
ncbi:MAG: hypothetical protein WKF75_04700, partial [Singulisphaera sp.]